jgi:hypothetical protein
MDLANQINTIGVEYGAETGEIASRVMREAVVAEDYHNAHVAGAMFALTEVARFTRGKIEAAGPYDDVRALVDLQSWLADMIRKVHEPMATDGNHDA